MATVVPCYNSLALVAQAKSPGFLLFRYYVEASTGMIIRILAEALILVLSAGIVLVHLAVYLGVARVAVSQKRGFRGSANRKSIGQFVSVVVPARNEEANLPLLFSSLESQTVQDFQLVLINDRSTDRTRELMEAYAAAAEGPVELVDLSEDDVIPGVNPKQNALAHGTRRCTGEIILFTDSDCAIPPTWVADSAARYADPKLGLMIGAITTRDTGGFVTRFHAFDHIFKYGYTAGSVGIGMPTGGFGNNLSIRRQALLDVGGFESLGFSTTEDAALIAAVRTETDWKVSAFISDRTLVTTAPFTSLRLVADQEVRWHIGGLFSTDLNTKLSYGYLMLYLTASILVIPFIALFHLLALMPLISFATMAGMAFLSGLLTRRPFRTFWLWFLPDLIFTMLFNSYLTLRALIRPNVVWKGSELTRGEDSPAGRGKGAG